MNPYPADARRYWSQAVLLVATLTLLAMSERSLYEESLYWGFYLTITVLAAIVGWWFTVRRDRPIMGPWMVVCYVVGAFLFLVYEALWIGMIPVLAISHFMTLVCVGKFLQRRTVRDDAQVFVLAFLLLVVASIVSGNVLFMLILALYLTVGIDALIRFHLAVERLRAAEHNAALAVSVASSATPVAPGPGRSRTSLTGVVAAMLPLSLGVGIVVFLLFPRVGSGMFGRWDTGTGAGAVTHFTPTVEFGHIGPIRTSNEVVMRVQIEYENGVPPREIEDAPIYFRGAVLDQYSLRRARGRGGRWGWHGSEPPSEHERPQELRETGEPEKVAALFPKVDFWNVGPVRVQHYWVEPVNGHYLFSCYPPIEVRSGDFNQVIRSPADQVLRLMLTPKTNFRYTIRTPERVPEDLSRILAEEGGHVLEEDPPVLRPDPSLPAEGEIRALIRELTADLEPPTTPEARERFVRRLTDYFHAGPFSYTLDPPAAGAGVDPVGEFLLRHHRGHCEYFASALAIMCQLSGVPARMVSGYAVAPEGGVGRFHVVRQKHAHAWVEVHIPGRGWVVFDPTPPETLRHSRLAGWWMGLVAYTDYLQFHWAHMVVEYDADVRDVLLSRFEEWLRRPVRDETTLAGAIGAFVRELFGWRLQLTWKQRMTYWAFALLVTALVVLMSYVLLVLLTWLVRGVLRAGAGRSLLRRRGVETAFYHRFCRYLEASGIRRKTGQTPAEFADELAERFGPMAEAPDLVGAYYEVAFGGRTLSPERRARIESFLERLPARLVQMR